KKDHHSWDPDLIYFDNQRTYLTCSYYVQQMFGQSSGQYYYGDVVTIDNKSNLQEQSAVLNTQKRELYVKLVNASGENKQAHIDLSRFGGAKKVIATTLTGKPEQENNYNEQPIAPKLEEIKLKGKKQNFDLKPYSFVMLTVKF
ncbi:MAG: alpha-L-arabinofuranosidase C-terminal domain-containing protein, partial [Bacteroidales bacterium]|nr:alpha-L-arabinofuranosidase C-terminal domain-containing protein [Bacteroidales bacterium]